MKRKNKALSFVIGSLIGTVLAVYATNQHESYAEAHKNDYRPIAEVQVIEINTNEPTEEPETIETTEYFDVPLSHELQNYIFAECEKHNIAPAIVVSMIEQESNYDSSIIGDDGESTGLLQIQKKWHEERMDRLGCTDLLDAFQNVTVAIDYLAELKDRNSDLYWVLMAYNSGASNANKRIKTGNISDYALEVVDRAMKLEGGDCSWN